MTDRRLTPAEAKALCEEWRASGDDRHPNREQLIVAHRKLAFFLVTRFMALRRGTPATRDELNSEAEFALVRSVDRFDPKRCDNFGAYVSPIIWQAMAIFSVRADSRAIYLPYQVAHEVSIYHKVLAKGAEPNRPWEAWLPSAVKATQGSCPIDDALDGADSHDFARVDHAEHLGRIMSGLTSRERKVVTMLYGLDSEGERQQKDVARAIKRTAKQVRIITTRAMAKMKANAARLAA